MKARAEAAEATGAAILDAAVEAFSKLPFDMVTLSDVAATSGVSVQTVIRRFRSKEGLFAAVREHEASRIRAAREVPTDASFASALQSLLDHYEDDGDVVLHLLAQEKRVDAVSEAVLYGRRVHREWVEQHCAFLAGDRTGIERERALNAAVVATDIGTWKLLRRDLGVEPEEVAAVMTALIDGLREES